MVASFAGKREYGVEENESITGRVWNARFLYVTAHSHLARVSKRIILLFLKFSNLFFLSGRGKLRILGHDCTLYNYCKLMLVQQNKFYMPTQAPKAYLL
jgi:hypothetical protein